MSGSGCGCCACLAASSSRVSTVNRPGLSSIRAGLGRHSTFFQQMIDRLSRPESAAIDPASPWKPYSLSPLTTRELDDPAIALLDAWAVVEDVLSFYQERIANEGYLRTATERRSLVELSRLVGYVPRPGVSASVYLAYTIDATTTTKVPAGSQVQSVPGPGEQAQTFETSEDLDARGTWNTLLPRMEQPQDIKPENWTNISSIYFTGTTTNLHAGDTLLFVSGSGSTLATEIRKIVAVTPDFDHDRTKVDLLVPLPFLFLFPLFEWFPLAISPSLPPASPADLKLDYDTVFSASSDTISSLVTSFVPQININYYAGLAGKKSPDKTVHVYALRHSFAMFGYNAPTQFTITDDHQHVTTLPTAFTLSDTERSVVYLEAPDDTIVPDSWVVIDGTADNGTVHNATAYEVQSVETRPYSNYGITGKTTRVTLTSQWRTTDTFDDHIRSATVLTGSEELTLANEPITTDIAPNPTEQGAPPKEPTKIPLGAVYDGLRAGRWVIIQGERTDIGGTTGVIGVELAMIASVVQNTDLKLPGDWVTTTITLSAPLAYSYKRDTVVIYGNVVKATNGRSWGEVLGGGDASQSLQTFKLHHAPLTFVSAPTPEGAATTLEVRVNDLRWKEAASLSDLGPSDAAYVTKIDDDGTTWVTFGTGVNGARLPTGTNNVRASYRSDIGKAANVAAGKISNAISRPLGVKDVINPAGATGGADPDTASQIRRNVPVSLRSLGRVVSVRDYEDFACTFAGIGKASAIELSNGAKRIVHLTIAGTDDIPIDPNSDLYRNLGLALSKYGNPYVSVQIDWREAVFLTGSASVRINPDYLWTAVYAQIRASLLDAFSFERRELGQPLFRSEVIAAIQDVPGVVDVEIGTFKGVTIESLLASQNGTGGGISTLIYHLPQRQIDASLARYDKDANGNTVIRPAQLVYLTPLVPEAFILTEIPA